MSVEDHPAWDAYVAALEAAREKARQDLDHPAPEGDPDD